MIKFVPFERMITIGNQTKTLYDINVAMLSPKERDIVANLKLAYALTKVNPHILTLEKCRDINNLVSPISKLPSIRGCIVFGDWNIYPTLAFKDNILVEDSELTSDELTIVREVQKIIINAIDV